MQWQIQDLENGGTTLHILVVAENIFYHFQALHNYYLLGKGVGPCSVLTPSSSEPASRLSKGGSVVH